jgi:DNA transposition AAA+ family ATPase
MPRSSCRRFRPSSCPENGLAWFKFRFLKRPVIGMTGLEKQFSHYAQFYSRVDFAHQYRALADDELLFVLQRHWKRPGKTLDPDDFTDQQAITAIDRITRGNFRLLDRLFTQVDRVLRINDLNTITEDVIEAARSTLVIGTPE